MPVLLVHDRDDEAVPQQHSCELHALLPRSTLLVTQGLGHNRLLRDPGVIERIVEFLAGAA